MNEIIYGIHAVQALLERDPSRLKQVYILKGRKDKRLFSVINQLKKFGIIIQLVNRQWMNRQTENAVHQGIFAQIKSGREYQ
ncbi:MAG: RNA methyltransferase substrate-binding domain-containing protein, partial [Arsenophonus sp. NC-QC1-MAG3]